MPRTWQQQQQQTAGTEVWCARRVRDLPCHQVEPLVCDIFASYSGPDKGLAIVPSLPVVPLPPEDEAEEKEEKKEERTTTDVQQPPSSEDQDKSLLQFTPDTTSHLDASADPDSASNTNENNAQVSSVSIAPCDSTADDTNDEKSTTASVDVSPSADCGAPSIPTNGCNNDDDATIRIPTAEDVVQREETELYTQKTDELKVHACDDVNLVDEVVCCDDLPKTDQHVADSNCTLAGVENGVHDLCIDNTEVIQSENELVSNTGDVIITDTLPVSSLSLKDDSSLSSSSPSPSGAESAPDLYIGTETGAILPDVLDKCISERTEEIQSGTRITSGFSSESEKSSPLDEVTRMMNRDVKCELDVEVMMQATSVSTEENLSNDITKSSNICTTLENENVSKLLTVDNELKSNSEQCKVEEVKTDIEEACIEQDSAVRLAESKTNCALELDSDKSPVECSESEVAKDEPKAAVSDSDSDKCNSSSANGESNSRISECGVEDELEAEACTSGNDQLEMKNESGEDADNQVIESEVEPEVEDSVAESCLKGRTESLDDDGGTSAAGDATMILLMEESTVGQPAHDGDSLHGPSVLEEEEEEKKIRDAELAGNKDHDPLAIAALSICDKIQDAFVSSGDHTQSSDSNAEEPTLDDVPSKCDSCVSDDDGVDEIVTADSNITSDMQCEEEGDFKSAINEQNETSGANMKLPFAKNVITIYRTQPVKRKHAPESGLSPPSGRPRYTPREHPGGMRHDSRSRTSPARTDGKSVKVTAVARSRTSPGRAQTTTTTTTTVPCERRARLAEPESDLEDDIDFDEAIVDESCIRLRPKFNDGSTLRSRNSRVIALVPDEGPAIVMKPRLADHGIDDTETQLPISYASQPVRLSNQSRLATRPQNVPANKTTSKPSHRRGGGGIIGAAKSRVVGRNEAKSSHKIPNSKSVPKSSDSTVVAANPTSTSPMKFRHKITSKLTSKTAKSGSKSVSPKSPTTSPPTSPTKTTTPAKLGSGMTVDMAKAEVKAKKKVARHHANHKRQVAPPRPCIAGATSWNVKSRKAYGISMSLYDQHPITRKISGDPIADSFAVCARQNNALLVVADGVNWGERSMLASRCAVHGCVNYVNENLFETDRTITDTHTAISLLLHSLDAAHAEILRHGAGLTTICAALVVPVANGRQYAVCAVAVGDSLAFVLSRRHGVREVTAGSRDLDAERDIRNAGGALGPVHRGRDPELNNLTCAMTLVDPGDIVFLTSDGVSDNFDPVVAGKALAKPSPDERPSSEDPLAEEKTAASGNNDADSVPTTTSTSDDANRTKTDKEISSDADKPSLSPRTRHRGGVAAMGQSVQNFEQLSEQSCSAQEVCATLLQAALRGTAARRAVLEDPALYSRAMKSRQRRELHRDVASRLTAAGGKLDHATVVAYEAGFYNGEDRGNDETDEDISASQQNAVRQLSFESNV